MTADDIRQIDEVIQRRIGPIENDVKEIRDDVIILKTKQEMKNGVNTNGNSNLWKILLIVMGSAGSGVGIREIISSIING